MTLFKLPDSGLKTYCITATVYFVIWNMDTQNIKGNTCNSTFVS